MEHHLSAFLSWYFHHTWINRKTKSHDNRCSNHSLFAILVLITAHVQPPRCSQTCHNPPRNHLKWAVSFDCDKPLAQLCYSHPRPRLTIVKRACEKTQLEQSEGFQLDISIQDKLRKEIAQAAKTSEIAEQETAQTNNRPVQTFLTDYTARREHRKH